MFAQAIVVIDFETSGMSPEQGGRVTEVAALRVVGAKSLTVMCP
jgi:DNA polymerase-3 subunit epsilon